MMALARGRAVGTGFGPTNPAAPAGLVVSCEPTVASALAATVGGVAALSSMRFWRLEMRDFTR